MTFKPYQLYLLSFLLSLLPLSLAQDDAAALVKIKEQLGNSIELSSWVLPPGSDICGGNIICNSARRVRWVTLRDINVNAPMLSAFGDLTELEVITIERMPGLYGPIPDSIGKLSHLQILNIYGTSISGPLPESLSSTNLSSISLTSNKINGSIPESLSTLPYLNFLSLANNSLTGSIPSGLVHGSATMPMWLILNDNKLTGELPKYYGGPYFDTRHTVYDYKLGLERLEFDLTHVQLPDTIGFLELGHNRIKGKVPKSLINVIVAVLDLSYNQLCGEIPTGGYMSWHKAASYENNKCLCGTPLPNCTKGHYP
ncbi:hypothetical protein LUZ60_007609 [Juncus effusus]|nr:hypothetical protein LUZ60_007609 [Juncus effusus]